MMGINAFERTSRAAILACAVGIIGACDDGDSTGVSLEDFQADAPAIAINDMLATADPAADATDQILSILDQLDIWEDGMITPQSAADARVPGPAALLSGARRYIPVMPQVEFDTAAGNTYVYDLEQSMWVVDPNDSGNAPANGIRVTIYAITLAGNLGPVIGYADLVDLDDEVTERLSVVVMDTSAETSYAVMDVSHAVTVTETASGTTEHGEVVGVLRSSPTEEVSLEIVSTRGSTGTAGEQVFDNDFSMLFESATSSYRWDIVATDEQATGEYTQDFTVTVSDASLTTVLDLFIEGNVNEAFADGTGTMSQGGQLVANVLLETDYAFTSPDDEPYDRAAQAQLQNTVRSMLLGGVFLVQSVPVLFPTPFLL